MKILIVSDAWLPQTNGVVRTLEATVSVLRAMGHDTRVVGPYDLPCWRVPLPTYPDISLALGASQALHSLMAQFAPDAIHIATEGPLGWAARHLCLAQKRSFTTAYHTHFPAYVAARLPACLQGVAEPWVWRVLRRFHGPAWAVLAPTAALVDLLKEKGLTQARLWPRGVDTDLFRPSAPPAPRYAGLQKPLLLYVGRVAVEKNLPAFLELPVPGTKIVVGEGPSLQVLKEKYPKALFVGQAVGEDLAAYYAGADLFVFPSKTDTLGLVLLEAAASGLRIAAFPASGPRDLFADPSCAAFAAMDEDLGRAVEKALSLPKNVEKARSFALARDWKAASVRFLTYLVEN